MNIRSLFVLSAAFFSLAIPYFAQAKVELRCDGYSLDATAQNEVARMGRVMSGQERFFKRALVNDSMSENQQTASNFDMGSDDGFKVKVSVQAFYNGQDGDAENRWLKAGPMIYRTCVTRDDTRETKCGVFNASIELEDRTTLYVGCQSYGY